MKTITVITKKTTTVEEGMQLQVPYFSKSPAFCYKVVNETQAIRVKQGVAGVGIDIVTPDYALDNEFQTPCTEEEFLTEYRKALAQIDELELSVTTLDNPIDNGFDADGNFEGSLDDVLTDPRDTAFNEDGSLNDSAS